MKDEVFDATKKKHGSEGGRRSQTLAHRLVNGSGRPVPARRLILLYCSGLLRDREARFPLERRKHRNA